MSEWQQWQAAARRAMVSGSCAALASAAVLAARGARDAADPVAPLNGPSQWLWGRGAPSVRGFSARHTPLGYAVHHAASIFWAILFERARARVGHPAACAVATAVTANIVDYQLTPKRLQPGYERQLSRRSLFWVYAALAGGFALGAALADRR